jgi:hypothetical protein
MVLCITPNIRRGSVFKHCFLEEESPYFMALKNKYGDHYDESLFPITMIFVKTSGIIFKLLHF